MLLKLMYDHEKVKVKSVSCVQLFLTLWTVAHQASPSMGFSRQEYWSGLPFPSPGDLTDPGIKLRSPALQADSLPSEPPGNTNNHVYAIINSYEYGNSDEYGNQLTLGLVLHLV